jgi:hypothetical protein
MGLSSKDRALNTKKVSYLDFKQLEMDRVLTALFARLAHNGFPSRLKRRFELSVEAFVDEFLEHPEWFTGFVGIVSRADLVRALLHEEETTERPPRPGTPFEISRPVPPRSTSSDGSRAIAGRRGSR